MRLDPELFWSVTPREGLAIQKAFLQWQDIENRRFGTVAAMAWNAQRYDKKQKKSWVEWHQLIPPFNEVKQKRGLTREEVLAQAKRMVRDTYGK